MKDYNLLDFFLYAVATFFVVTGIAIIFYVIFNIIDARNEILEYSRDFNKKQFVEFCFENEIIEIGGNRYICHFETQEPK